MAPKHFLLLLWIILIIAVSGCATNPKMAAWPEPRPLGAGLLSYTISGEPPKAPSPTPEYEEPKGVLTLRQALSLSLTRNPEIAAFGEEVRAGEARSLQASLLPNPEIDLAVENVGGGDANSGFETAETTVELSQLIELGAKGSKRFRVAALERDLAGWDYETKRLDIFTTTTIAFVDVLAAQERLRFAKETLRLSEQVFNTVAERVKAGKVSPLEEVKAAVTLSISRIQVETSDRNLKAARKRLASKWGSTSPRFEKAEGSLDVVGPLPSAEYANEVAAQSPEIARWDDEIRRRRAALSLERARRIPDLTISGGIRRFEETDDHAIVMGVSIPVPFFDRNQGGILEAESRLAKAKEEHRASETAVRTALAETYETLSSAHAQALGLKNEVLPATRLAFDAANEGYREGKFGFLQVLDAQRTLFEAKGEYIEALTRYHKSKANLERLIGQGLDDSGGTPAPEPKGDKQ